MIHPERKVGVTCLIPCFNEVDRVGAVLDAMQQVAGLEKVLCVDDGSQDGTAGYIANQFPQIGLLRLPQNGGKTAAVYQGLLALDSEYVFLVDADLQNIQPQEFTDAVMAVKNQSQIDMLILRRVKKDALTRFLRGDILITGERIVRRSLLLELLEQHQVRGYQLELALNQMMIDQGKVVRWIPSSATGAYALRKLGVWAGLRKEVRMFTSLLAFLGWRKTLNQMLYFGRERV